MLDWTAETDEKWTTDGLATYYELLYNEYALPYWYYDYSVFDNHFFQQFRENLGGPIDTLEDMRELENAYTYYVGRYDPNSSYIAGSSFIQFLINQFGENDVLNYILVNRDINSLTDLTFDELVEWWRESLEENYSNYLRK